MHNLSKQIHPILADQLLPMLRKNDKLSTYLNTVSFGDIIDTTNTKANCYFLNLDGNKRPRVNDFARFIAEKIVDYAIPRTEIDKAKKQMEYSGSSAPMIRLNNKAKKLFTSLPKSGEGGEVLLSVLAEVFLGLPQLFTKMVLKTSSEMHVHGSDGIHAGTNDTGHLTLYWGESKLYSSVTDAVKECFSSLAPFLNDSGGSGAEQERDLQLLRDGVDLSNIDLNNAMKAYLDPNNPMFNQVEYRGLCLVGFDSDKYPATPNSKEIEELRNDIKQVYEQRKAHIQKRIVAEKIDSFTIELFLIPFPDVDEFRKAFRREIGVPDE